MVIKKTTKTYLSIEECHERLFYPLNVDGDSPFGFLIRLVFLESVILVSHFQ